MLQFLRCLFGVIGSLLISNGLSWAAEPAASEAKLGVSEARQKELTYFVKQDCGSCHGMTLKGGLGPSLLPQRLKAKPVGYLVQIILNGRPGGAMPPFKKLLSETEATWIAESLKKGI